MVDSELLQRFCRDGSTADRDELIRRYLPVVYRLARREVADEALAADITQAVFVIFLRKSQSLSRRVHLGGWFFNVVRYAAADERKARQRRQRHEAQAAAMRPESTRHADRIAESTPVSALNPLLNDALAKLSQSDRELLILKFLSDQSSEKVAIALSISEQSLRQRLSRALRRLKDSMGGAASEATLALLMDRREVPEHLSTLIHQVSIQPRSRANQIVRFTTRKMLMFKLKLSAGLITLAALVVMVVVGLHKALAQTAAVNPPAPAINLPVQVMNSPATVPVYYGAATQPADTVRHAYAACAAGDADGFINCFNEPSAKQRIFLTQLSHILVTAQALHVAAAKKFGPRQADDLVAVFHTGVTDADIASCTQTLSGDTAQVTINHNLPQIPLKRLGAVWKIAPDFLSNVNADVINAQEQKIPDVDRIISKVDAGDYATINAVQVEVGKVLGSAQ